MIDRTRLDPVALLDVAVLTRRHLIAVLGASLVFPSALPAFADGDKGTSEKDNNGDSGDTDSSRDTNDGHSEGVGSSRSGREVNDQETARKAVAEGHVLPLKDVLSLIDRDRYGIVIAVDMKRYRGNDVYRLKTRDGAGVIRDLRIDARTGKFLNILGF